MLDHRVAVDDVKLAVGERQVAAVRMNETNPAPPTDFRFTFHPATRQRIRPGVFPLQKIARPHGSIGNPNVQDACICSRAKLAKELLQPGSTQPGAAPQRPAPQQPVRPPPYVNTSQQASLAHAVDCIGALPEPKAWTEGGKYFTNIPRVTTLLSVYNIHGLWWKCAQLRV